MRFRSLLIFLFLLAGSVLAQPELLANGAYGATIHGGMKAEEKKAYFLTAEEGQILKATVTSRNTEEKVTFELLDSQGESVLGGLEKVTKINTLDLVLPKEDRYVLKLVSGKEPCSYVLEVTLEEAEDTTRGRPSPLPFEEEPVETVPVVQPSPSPVEPEEHPSEVDL